MVSLLEELTRTELVRILKDTKNSLLKQYRKLFLMEGADLHFLESHFGDCRQALEMKTGARALRSIMESIMLEVMYDLPSIEEPVKVVINAGVVKGKSKAKILPIETGKKRDAA